MAKIILTGDRPTGKLHLGHFVGSLSRRVELQNTGIYDKIFIMIADAQALTDNADNPDKVRENIIEVALDYLSCGIDPTKSTIFIQSYVTELTELAFYYMNLVTVQRLQRNPTVKAEITLRGFAEHGEEQENQAVSPCLLSPFFSVSGHWQTPFSLPLSSGLSSPLFLTQGFSIRSPSRAEQLLFIMGFPGSSDGREPACNSEDPGSIPGLGRSPGEGQGNPLQYSCLENPWTEDPGGLQSMGWQRVRQD